MITSIVIPTFNKLNYTIECIDSIRKYTTLGTYEIIIVDNCSTDGTQSWLENQKDIKVVLNNENLGFPEACNQGMRIATGDNILLLNNDVVVTNLWLDNLLKALYSKENVGAVGPVTNSAAYYTSIPVSYNSIDEMQKFAFEYNTSDETKWEQRLKLIGYCMLIKTEVFNKVGLLDERFSPGNFEDDDYSLRIRNLGYNLLLCKDTFIHHYGSVSWKEDVLGYNEILSVNEQKFREKWGTNIQTYEIHNSLINNITYNSSDRINVLHIGCGAGATLLKIKNNYKNSSLYGIEGSVKAASEAGNFAKIYPSFGEAFKEWKEIEFDVIIITDWNGLFDLKLFMSNIKDILSGGGILLASSWNALNLRVINSLIAGKNQFLQTRYMALADIHELFKGFDFIIQSVTDILSVEEEKMVDFYCSCSNSDLRIQYETVKYLIKAQKYNVNIEKNIQNLIDDLDVDNSYLNLNGYSFDEITDYIMKVIQDKIKILQKLAILNYINDNHDEVLNFLELAYRLNPENSDTLYNLGLILFSYNEKSLAKQYLEQLAEDQRNDEVERILTEIKNEEEEKLQQLIVLLRRIEFDIDKENTKKEMTFFFSKNIYNEHEVIDCIFKNTINKEKVLNAISIIAFENGLTDYIFPFLNKAFEINNGNDDTLFNLGYILLEFGDKLSALSYFEKIMDKDEEVLKIIQSLRGSN